MMQSLSRVHRAPPPKPGRPARPTIIAPLPAPAPSPVVTDPLRPLRALLEAAAEEAGFSVKQLRGPQRVRRIVDARWRFMRAAYAKGYPLTLIGRAINRDHTTVCYALGLLSDRKPRR